MAEVTPGWLMTKAMASSMSVTPAHRATWASSSTMSSLRWLAGLVMSYRALEVGLDAESFRHRPESQPPASGL
jgi:hypothetical protein